MSNFNRWLKENLSHSPRTEVDQRILSHARTRLVPSKKKSFWPLSAVAGAGALALVFMVLTKNKTPELHPALFVPTEVLLYQEDLELMVESADLSDAEWEKLTGDNA